MRKRIWKVLLLLAVAVCAMACGSRSEKESSHEAPGILATVPSDALLTAAFDRLEDGLAVLLDSNSVFRKLDYGRYSRSACAFSYNYAVNLVPLLAIDAGRAERDTVSASFVSDARSKGLRLRQVDLDGRLVVLLSTSENMLSQSAGHVQRGSSILDAPGFKDAVCKVGGNAVYVRNSSVSHLFPRNFAPFSLIPRKDMVKFVRECADWMAFTPQGDGAFTMTLSSEDLPTFYPRVLEGLDPDGSELGEMIPENAAAVVDIPMKDWRKYRAAYEKYLDAYNRLQRIPASQDWAEAYDIKEVATIFFEGTKVLLVRGRRYSSSMLVPYAAVESLFGKIFALPENVTSMMCDDWMVIGTDEALRRYSSAEKAVPADWPDKAVHAVVWFPGTLQLRMSRTDNLQVY